MYDSVHEKTCSSGSWFGVAAQQVEERFLRKVNCPNPLHFPFGFLLVLQMFHLAFVVTLGGKGLVTNTPPPATRRTYPIQTSGDVRSHSRKVLSGDDPFSHRSLNRDLEELSWDDLI